MESKEATRMVVTIIDTMDKDSMLEIAAAVRHRLEVLGVKEEEAPVPVILPTARRRRVLTPMLKGWRPTWWRLLGNFDEGLMDAGKGLFSTVGSFFSGKRLSEIIELAPEGALFLTKMESVDGVDYRLYYKTKTTAGLDCLKTIVTTVNDAALKVAGTLKREHPSYPTGHPALGVMKALCLMKGMTILNVEACSVELKSKVSGGEVLVCNDIARFVSSFPGYVGAEEFVVGAGAPPAGGAEVKEDEVKEDEVL